MQNFLKWISRGKPLTNEGLEYDQLMFREDKVDMGNNTVNMLRERFE
jgi:hypothetical protein